jgi:hypothetical protein
MGDETTTEAGDKKPPKPKILVDDAALFMLKQYANADEVSSIEHSVLHVVRELEWYRAEWVELKQNHALASIGAIGAVAAESVEVVEIQDRYIQTLRKSHAALLGAAMEFRGHRKHELKEAESFGNDDAMRSCDHDIDHLNKLITAAEEVTNE